MFHYDVMSLMYITINSLPRKLVQLTPSLRSEDLFKLGDEPFGFPCPASDSELGLLNAGFKDVLRDRARRVRYAAPLAVRT